MNFYYHLVQDVDDYLRRCLPIEDHMQIPMVRVRKLKSVHRTSY